MSQVQLSIPIPPPDPKVVQGSTIQTLSGRGIVTHIQPIGNDHLVWASYGGNGVPQPHQPEAIVNNDCSCLTAPTLFHPEDQVVVVNPPEGESDLKGRTGTVVACVQVDGVLKVKLRLEGDQLFRRLPFECIELVERKDPNEPYPLSVDYLQTLALRLNEADRRQLAQALLNSLASCKNGASAICPVKPQNPSYKASGWIESTPYGHPNPEYRYRWRTTEDGKQKRKSRKLKTPLELKLFQWLTQPDRSQPFEFNLRVLDGIRRNLEETLDTLVSSGILSDIELTELINLDEQEEGVQRFKADMGLNKRR